MIKQLKRTAIAAVLAITVCSLNAQDTTRLTLQELLRQVESEYPSLSQYDFNVQSYEAKAAAAKAWMAPTFTTGLMDFPYNLSMINEEDPMNQAGLLFSLEQMIPSPRKQNAKRDYLLSLGKIESSRKEWTANELRRESKLLYYNRYINERKQRIIAEADQLLNLLIYTAEQKFANNQTQLQTIFKARARLAEIRNMRIMLESLIAESNIGINILLQRDATTPFSIDTFIAPKKYYGADTFDVSARTDITAMQANIETMRLEQELMRVSTRPDFGVSASHAQMFGMPSQWSVMGMVTLPFVPWSSKMYKSEIKSLGYQVQSMEQQIETMELMAKRMQAEKIAMLNFENAQYANYKNEIIPAYEDNLEANLLAYGENTGNFYVLLDAWEMLLMKKLDMLDKLSGILKLEATYEFEANIK